jgi:predicted RNA binding protein YcfA (HicA-like mRNA interferase family)
MPLKLKVISGQELVSNFERLGFVVASQKGSHIKLKRSHAGGTQILVIPNHKTLNRGTLLSIYRIALTYLPEETLKPIFYTE